MNNKYHTVIVGGGLGGLCAAVALTKAGKKVIVLEKHHVPGGCATTFKRMDKKKNLFEFESSLHQIAGLDGAGSVGKVIKEMGLSNDITPVRQKKTYVTSKHHIDADNFDIFVEQLKGAFPKEANNIDIFFKDLMVLLNVIDGTFDKSTTPKNLPEWNNISALDLAKKYFKDKDLIDVLLANYAYYADDKTKVNAFYYFYPEMEYIVHGSWYIKGGSQRLSDALKAKIESQGGEVKLLSQVTKVNLDEKKKKIVSIEIKDGTTYFANNFAFNTSPMQINRLAGVEEHTEETKNLEFVTSFEGAFVGLDCNPDKVGMTEQEYHLIGKNYNYILSNYTKKDSSKEKDKIGTVTIITVARASDWPEYKSEAYNKKKKKMEDELKKLLMKEFKGIEKHITVFEGMTPYTIERYTFNEAGAMYGHEQYPNYPERKSETRFSNAFITGAWGDVGGGYEGAMLGGYFTGKRIAKKGSSAKLVDFTYSKFFTIVNVALISMAFQLWGLFMFTVFKDMDSMQDKVIMTGAVSVGIWSAAYLSFRAFTKFKQRWLPTKVEFLSLLLILLMPVAIIMNGNDMMAIREVDGHAEGSLIYFGAFILYALVWIISAFKSPFTCEYSKWQIPATHTSREAFRLVNKFVTLMWGVMFIVTAVLYLLIPEPYSSIAFSLLSFGPLFMKLYENKTIVTMPMKK